MRVFSPLGLVPPGIVFRTVAGARALSPVWFKDFWRD